MNIHKHLIFFCTFFFLQSARSQNIALDKKYIVSTAPNYPLSAPPTDNTSLTDGAYTTNGILWVKPTTVGWQRINKLSITIDLEEIQPISTVTFNTARRMQAGVFFPANIYVFFSKDGENFTYEGDAAALQDNQPGDYEVKKFFLKNINQSARYVMLTIMPQGTFMFSDEIEIIKSKSVAIIKKNSIKKENLYHAVDSIKAVEKTIKKINQVLLTYSSAPNPVISKEQATKINSQLRKRSLSSSDLTNINNQINQYRIRNLKNKFRVPFTIEKCTPWDILQQPHNPTKTLGNLNYQFKVVKSGVQYGSFIVTNITAESLQISLDISHIKSNNDLLKLFKVADVPADNNTEVSDPLIPVTGKILISSGKSQMFIFQLLGHEAGSFESVIKVRSVKNETQLRIKYNVTQLNGFDIADELNAVNWAYLTYPMLKDRKKEAAIDLQNHQINTIVVPPAIIPRPGSSNFTELTNYLSYFKYAKNILLFTDYTSQSNRYINNKVFYMSSTWQSNFKEWYTQLLSSIKSAGISSQIYFYPYDEVATKNIEDFRNLILWAKASVPGIEFYATLANKEAVNALLPLLDIAQLLEDRNLLDNRPLSNSEIWMYKVGTPPARALSPYTFYRLMAWKAFLYDIRGIGFWNYADEGNDNKLNRIADPLFNTVNSYSVVYNGAGKDIITTRRWEAFKLGLEDSKLLSLYSKKFGKSKANKLAQRVISSPGNTSMADSVRTQIIKEL